MKLKLKTWILTCTFLAGFATAADPAISIANPLPLDEQGKATFSATGFPPDSEVIILFTSKDGVATDIGYALEPSTKTDANGNWSGTWSYGRFVKKKLIEKGVYKVTANDSDFMPIAETTLIFE